MTRSTTDKIPQNSPKKQKFSKQSKTLTSIRSDTLGLSQKSQISGACERGPRVPGEQPGIEMVIMQHRLFTVHREVSGRVVRTLDPDLKNKIT